MVNDAHRLFAVAADGAALYTLMCVSQGVLVSTFGHSMAFNAHAQACMVHHGEHVVQAFACFTNQMAACTFKSHHTSRARVYAHFVFQRHGMGMVVSAHAAIGLYPVFRHQKQRNAFHARRSIGQTRQHHVHDVVDQLMVAPRDEDFLAINGVSAIAQRFGFTGHLCQI